MEEAVAEIMSELPAGRELDALVAEKVFGRTIVGWDTAIYVEGEWSIHLGSDPKGWACHADKSPLALAHCVCEFYDSADAAISDAYLIEEMRNDGHPNFRGDLRPDPKCGGHYASCLDVVPPYSTSIAAAWQVVEKMRESLEVWRRFQKTLLAEVSAELRHNPTQHGGPWRFVRPEHICRAALKAVEATAP